MMNLVRQRSLLVLKMKRDNIASAQVTDKPLSYLDDFTLYPSRIKLLSDFEKRVPMSVVCVEGNELALFAVVRENNTTSFYKFEFDARASVLRSSLHSCYYRLDLPGTSPLLEVPKATASCVLLPYPLAATNSLNSDGYFTIIDSNWRSIDINRNLVLPHTILGDVQELERDIQVVPV